MDRLLQILVTSIALAAAPAKLVAVFAADAPASNAAADVLAFKSRLLAATTRHLIARDLLDLTNKMTQQLLAFVGAVEPSGHPSAAAPRKPKEGRSTPVEQP